MTFVAIVFVVLMVLGLPVAFAIGISGFVFFVLSDVIPPSIGVQKIASVSQSFPLLAVPFFVLAGHLMNAGGITDRLFDFSRVAVSWMAGSLAQVSILLSTTMGGVSATAVADAAMEARLLGPAMQLRGYSKGYAASVIAFSSVITATIPPSIGLVLFGFVNEVSVGKLLLGGVIPGLLMTAVIMGVTGVIAHRHGYAPELAERPGWREIVSGARECFWALMFPVFLLAGFRFGAFTATEAGAVVVVYALLVGGFIYRELTWKTMREALQHSVHDIGMVMLIIIMAAALGHVIIIEQGPQVFSEMLRALETPYGTLFLVLLILFVAGMIMEATVNVLLLTPLLMPALIDQGFDPVHVGVLIVILITFGGNTPPVGVIMYTVCGILKCSFAEFVRTSIPFILAMAVFLALLALTPQSVLLLPNLLM